MEIYKGKKVTLNKPSRIRQGEPGHGGKKFKVHVNDNGKVKKVMFGDPNLSIKKHIKKNKDSYNARGKCKQKKDKTTAGYWSCYMWNN